MAGRWQNCGPDPDAILHERLGPLGGTDPASFDDRVALRWKWEGTHQNNFREFEPTGKRVSNTAIAIYELRDGKVVRAWLQTDRLGFLETMGALPESVTARLRGGPPKSAPAPRWSSTRGRRWLR